MGDAPVVKEDQSRFSVWIFHENGLVELVAFHGSFEEGISVGIGLDALA